MGPLVSADAAAPRAAWWARVPLDRARVPVEDLVARAQAVAPDPAIFAQHPPFFWRAEISNSALDAYYTRMATSSLQNYAADATAGVSFLPAHDVRAAPLGRSLRGEYQRTPAGQREWVTADFYTLQGADPAVDAFIARVRGGLVQDVSIGFYGARFRCSLCGAVTPPDARTGPACDHVPGLEYPDPTSGRRQLAFLWVEDAHLAEVSAVYEGATPGATIVAAKARALAAAGALPREAAEQLRARYAVPVEVPRVFAVAPAGARAAQEDAEDAMEWVTDLRAALAAADGAAVPDDPAAVLTAVREALAAGRAAQQDLAAARAALERATAERDALRAELETLRPLAADGARYREDLLAAALAEGVRAHGAAFPRERWAERLAQADLAFIQDMQAEWAAIAAARLPAGRQTTDVPAPPAPARAVPLAAFRP